HVAAQAHVDRAAAPARHPVAAPARMYEAHFEAREAGDDVGLDERGVEALVRDTVAVEDHTVAVSQIEIAWRSIVLCRAKRPCHSAERSRGGHEQEGYQDCQSPGQCLYTMNTSHTLPSFRAGCSAALRAPKKLEILRAA